MKRTIAGCAALLVLAACPVPQYMRNVPPPPLRTELLVSANQLSRRLNDPGTVILHVGRNRADYDAGHVPGAHWLPLSSIVTERAGLPNELPDAAALDAAFEAAGVSDASRVVIYGDLGGLAAARAFFTLDYLGHPSHALLDGGLEAWRAAGKTVETREPGVSRGSFNPRVRPEVLASAEWVRDHLRDSTVVLADARPPAEFSGETPGEGVTRPGHIAGAKNLYWRTLVTSEQNPTLRSPDVMRALVSLTGARTGAELQRAAEERRRREAMLAQLDTSRRRRAQSQPRAAQTPPTGSTIVAYCRTGVQASMVYFVSRYLGYDAKLYDGSYIDWSRRGADFPVER